MMLRTRPEPRNSATGCCASTTRTDLRKREFVRFPATWLGVAQHQRNTLTCGNTVCATNRRNGPRRAALGASTMGQGLEPDHGQLVALRPVRETARHASPVRGRQEGPRPDLAARHGQVPALRPAGTKPADPHLHGPNRLQEAEGRPEAPAAGRGTQAETETRRRTETGPGEGTPAGRGREAQAGRCRCRCQAQGRRPCPVTRQEPARLRDLFGCPLRELPLPHLQGRRGGRRGQGPRRGRGHRIRQGLRQGLPRRVRRRGRIRRQVRRFQ